MRKNIVRYRRDVAIGISVLSTNMVGHSEKYQIFYFALKMKQAICH